jgi:hypothetical protein
LEAVRDAAGIERAIQQFAREPNGGLIPLPSPLIGLRRDLIISLASRQRLPNVYGFRGSGAPPAFASRRRRCKIHSV